MVIFNFLLFPAETAGALNKTVLLLKDFSSFSPTVLGSASSKNEVVDLTQGGGQQGKVG